MTKKILLLVLFLPMIIMISLFTTTDAVSLAISIPVTGIEIVEDNIVYLDLDQEETYKIDYTVYPTNASNAEVALSTERVGDNRLANVEFKDGYLIPKSIGMAKVYLSTIDGGFKDSFIIQVDSNMLQEIECEISDDELYVGETAVITTTFIPANAKNQVIKYKSGNETVATVDNYGNVKAVGRGETLITISSVDDETVMDTVKVNVYNTDIMDISDDEVITWDQTGSINLSIDSDVEYTLNYDVLDAAGNKITTDNLTATFGEEDENGNVKLTYTFKESFIGKLQIKVTIKTALDYELSKVVKIERVNKIDIKFVYSKTPQFVQGSSSVMNFMITPINAQGVTYDIEVADKKIANVTELEGMFILEALLPGVTKVTVKAHVEGIEEKPEDVPTATIDVVVMPKFFNVVELGKTYGIEGVWTVAQHNMTIANGQMNLEDAKNQLTLSYGKEVGANFFDYVKWVAVDADGKEIKEITISEDEVKSNVVSFKTNGYKGDAFIKAVYSFGDASTETTAVAVQCAGDTVNVSCYEELLLATKAEKAIVLTNDVTDFGYYKNGEVMGQLIKDSFGKEVTIILPDSAYTKMPTTYDWTYYKNLGYTNAPTVNVLINFKNNVYGNGYTINAHNVASALDSSGKHFAAVNPMFNGSLNFVAVTDSNSSSISVKGQDNISFAVHGNVDINNVILKGCNLDDSDGSIDLTDLDYTGTVVEVLGDNVNINYSRINNGKMCMRIFGDINDPNKVINVNINNCILSGAREFLIRMGSNAFIEGGLDPNNCSPYLPNNTVTEFPVQPSYHKKTAEQKKAYEDAFIKTFVTVKNSAFKDCGIFSIGMDSHFSGGLLANGSEALNGRFAEVLGSAWKNLARTSYGAKLTFDGDVRIYDWKLLDSVNSSTLIEKNMKMPNELFDKIDFDIKNMVEVIVDKPGYTNVVYKDKSYNNGQTYVHGGIAFFGGGKNYGVFEEINSQDSFAQLNGYRISLGDVDASYLSAAAGDEDFYFLLHDATNLAFTPKHQDEILVSSDAYTNVYKK